MNIRVLIIAAALFAAVPATSVYAQRMTDEQVLSYVKQGISEGKSQTDIAAELARRGVSREQAERVKKMYNEQKRKNESAAAGQNGEVSDSRMRSAAGGIEEPVDMQQMLMQQQQLLQQQQKLLMQQQQQQNQTPQYRQVQPQQNIPGMQTGIPQPFGDELFDNEQVFGRNIFNTRNLTFEPNGNMATPPGYRLGPGDEVIIDIWGASQNTFRETISPDGTINLEELGPVYLSGMQVRDAERYLQSELGKIYSHENNQIKVTLGNSRTIQINIMGEVVQPGTYALSAFSTVLNALYRAGGVSDIGSLRDVRLVRNGKTVAAVDVYDFILNGKIKDDISLQEGDVIIVPSYEILVKISGNVKRNMKFEMKNGETLAQLLNYAGGFDADAYSRSLRIVRQNGEEYEVKTVDEPQYASTALRNGDEITVGAILNRYSNMVEIRGAVYRPDIYELGGGITTVRGLIERANGLMPEAFTNRAVLQRLRDDMTREVLQVDIRGIMNGTAADIALSKNDILYIPSIHDLKEFGDITVHGEVAQPGNYAYADNMTLEDIIIQAGGLLESASTVRVDVSRRIKNPTSMQDSETIGETFTFSLKDGFVIDGQPGFALHPYDHVYVRRSPAYQVQLNAYATGEVVFDGAHAMTSKSERISDLVKKAGGVTPSAYIRGARLTRVANMEERKRMQDVLTLMGREMGNEMLDSLEMHIDTMFTVGIDLEAALAKPGSEADLVLREGDQLFVPKYNNTVKINGAVMMPNTVSFDPKYRIDQYISQAGGYSQSAKKSKKFIVYMNGKISKVKGNGRNQIEPGCEIIIPMKQQRADGRSTLSQILGYTTSIASLGTMAASIASLSSK